MNLFIISIMDLFNEGQKLTLLFQKDLNMVEMSCSIEHVFADRLSLLLPQYFMRYIDYLQVGNKLTAKAFSKLGTIDFNTVVISSPLEDNFLIELDYNSIKLTSGNEIPVIKAIEHLEITINDSVLKLKTFEISTEQIKFNCKTKLKINDLLDCSLILPQNYGIINFKAIVTEIDPIYETEYTASYSTMTEQARQTLLYYMYMYSKDTK